ncbi:MAG: hypothetical protein GY938_11300 [Ketobacter sp.]|nr:hypothetical protein [Ketobacter sp.]
MGPRRQWADLSGGSWGLEKTPCFALFTRQLAPRPARQNRNAHGAVGAGLQPSLNYP